MSYSTMYALAMDPAFRDRVVACAVYVAAHEAEHNEDPSYRALGVAIVAAAENALGLIKLVAADPAVGSVTNHEQVTDEQMLSAVKTVWLTYARALYPPADLLDPGV